MNPLTLILPMLPSLLRFIPVSYFEKIGAKAFPKLAPELHVLAGVITSYDRDYVKWLQGALNEILSPSPALVVDGKYGDMTRTAVERFQQEIGAQFGLKVDGFAGLLTSNIIDLVLSGLPATAPGPVVG